MRILIAPDSFKGSLSAFEVARAIQRGVARARPEAETDRCPLSDGGEGFARVLLAACGGTLRSASVVGPISQRVQATWALLADGRTAVIESAEAIGLGLVSHREPTRTTSYGVGELIREALTAGARTIVIGLGGSATTDGGAGMAQALGVALDGAAEPITADRITALRSIDAAGRDPRLAGVDLVVAVDVDNPLTGIGGAARTYAPQKGATETEAAELDAALEHWAELAGDAGLQAGDGAAGGLGYGLRVFAGARLKSGIDLVLDQVRFDEKLRGCGLVLTGEGRLDAQTARGKVVSGVCRRCRSAGIPAVALAGTIGPGADELREHGLTEYFSLCDDSVSETFAREHASELLEALADKVVSLRGYGAT
jgi:glycerate 2-kinase